MTGRRAYIVAWSFFVAATALGLLLRIQALFPIEGLNYAYFLHSHSHTAFHGWVYNAFFALALQVFVPPARRASFGLLFLVTQVATVGMMVTFPFQGYALESILFSSLHVACSAVFAWKLLRQSETAPAARVAMRWAFGFMFLSAAGPVALGPLAAADLRSSPWYAMSIYFYLHFQYNGWFLFFLKALGFQRLVDIDTPELTLHAARAVHWLAAGTLLTVTLSALWMLPPGWVYVVGMVGAVLQLVGCAHLMRWVRGGGQRVFTRRLARNLGALALAAFLLKHGMQFASAWPVVTDVAIQRTAVIGFLHLVFLGIVSPMLIAWAFELDWLHDRATALTGLALLAFGATVTELTLFSQALPGMISWMRPWPRVGETLMIAGGLMLIGVVLLGAGFRGRRDATRLLS